MSIINRIEAFMALHHNVTGPESTRPNWMSVYFTNDDPDLRPLIVNIDHKSFAARRDLGILISQIWQSVENWELHTYRPDDEQYMLDIERG